MLEASDEPFRNGNDMPQFHALWVTDHSKDGPVFTLDVDGTVMPMKRAPKLVERLGQLAFEAAAAPKKKKSKTPDFDAEHTLLSAMHEGGPAHSAGLDVLK